MSSRAVVGLKDVWAMLGVCAKGYKATQGNRNEYWRIVWGEKVYPYLPTGRHGRRENPEIQVGHIRHMARAFGILECAKKQLSLL